MFVEHLVQEGPGLVGVFACYCNIGIHDNLQLTYSLPLQMKVRLLQSYVVDLSDQNNVLVQMMEELERETEWKVAALEAELQVLFAVHGCTKECALCSLGIIALCLQSIL